MEGAKPQPPLPFLQVRKRLLQGIELAQMRAREKELDDEGADRVALVEDRLRQRDAEREFIAEQRIEELRRRLEAESDAAAANVQVRNASRQQPAAPWVPLLCS